MILVGALQVIDGLIALFNDEFYAVRSDGLGRQHRRHRLGLDPPAAGILLIAASYAVHLGPGLGRTLGVTAARLSAIDKPSSRSHSTVTAASR